MVNVAADYQVATTELLGNKQNPRRLTGVLLFGLKLPQASASATPCARPAVELPAVSGDGDQISGVSQIEVSGSERVCLLGYCVFLSSVRLVRMSMMVGLAWPPGRGV